LLCFRQILNEDTAIKHVKTHRSCHRCGKNYAGASAKSCHIAHLKCCKGPRYAICQFCGKKRATLALNEHLKTCQQRLKLDPPKYVCNYCGKQFRNRLDSWQKHTMFCTQQRLKLEPPKYVCNYCGLRFRKSMIAWKKHTVMCTQNPDQIGTLIQTTFKTKTESVVLPEEEILGP
jgi:hypothetical protein